MKTHIAFGSTMVLGLWLAACGAHAADAPPPQRSLAIPVNVAGRAAGAVECLANVGTMAPIATLAFSPDGKTLAVGGYKEVVLWDLAGAKLAERFPVAAQVGAVALLKDGKWLAIGEGLPARSGAVRLLDVASGQEAFRSDDPKDVVLSLAVSPDGKLLAASGAYNVAHVWNVDEKKLVATLQGHSDRVLHVAFNPDGKFLVTSGADSVALVWDVSNWQSIVRFAEAQAVRASAFNPDGLQVLLAVGGPSAWGLRVRRTDNPPSRRPIGTGVGMPLSMVGPSKDNRVYVPCTDGTVKVYDIRNANLLTTLSGHRDWVYAAAVSPDGTRVASAGADGTVKLWSAPDNRLLATLVQLAPRADQWLVVTSQGHLATSAPASLAWKAANLTTPPDQILAQLQNPELVGKFLAGEKIPAPTIK